MRRKVFYSILASLGLLTACVSAAEEPQPSEYQLKAVFLYNFAKFVEWPVEAFTSTNTPFTIGILGQNPFGDYLESTVRNKAINGHPFAIQYFKSILEATNCHILFIAASERRRLPEILKAVSSGNVLTVSETDRFLQAGGMIRFFMDENKVRFDINDEAARSARLRISSKLLSVARRVETGASR
jgi:hypothetical protein